MSALVQRIYNISDAVLIAFANVIYSLLTSRFAAFSVYDPQVFNADFLPNFRNMIDIASATGQDRDIVRGISEETAEMHKARDGAIAAYKKLRYHVRKIGKNNPELRNRFGTEEFGQLSNGPVENFILFLENIELIIIGHLDALTTALYTPEKHAEYQAAVAALRLAKQEQDEAIRLRPFMTMSRREQLNALYLALGDIRDSAKDVYSQDPASADLFKLPAADKPKKKDVTPTPTAG